MEIYTTAKGMRFELSSDAKGWRAQYLGDGTVQYFPSEGLAKTWCDEWDQIEDR